MQKGEKNIVESDRDNTAQAHCVLDTYAYKQTLRICNSYLLFHCNNGYTSAPHCYKICP